MLEPHYNCKAVLSMRSTVSKHRRNKAADRKLTHFLQFIFSLLTAEHCWTKIVICTKKRGYIKIYIEDKKKKKNILRVKFRV